MLKMMGASSMGNNIVMREKGLSVAMYTEGEIWVQDPSRVWLLEYDPDGSIKQNYVNFGR
jgi:hypothetical protein